MAYNSRAVITNIIEVVAPGMRNPPLLLIVDDDNDFLDVLLTKFKAAGFEVVGAHDGLEGVAQAKEAKPDLILMDVKMPRLDGIGALLKMRAPLAF